jgi:spore maturation protein CgeB
MVSNPYLGVEEWFEPGTEIMVAHNQQEAIDAYTALLREPSFRKELGARARQRLLAEHTYEHRAQQLLEFIGRGGVGGERRLSGALPGEVHRAP